MRLAHAFRVILTYHRDEFRVSGVTRIEKLVPPSDDIEDSEVASGAWYSLEDEDSRTLYRRIIDNPLAGREVFTGEERGLRRELMPHVPFTLSLLVPEIAGAQSLALYATGAQGGRAVAPVEPLFTVTVAELDERAAQKGTGDGR